MSELSLVPVTPSRHGGKFWKPASGYLFAKSNAAVTMTGQDVIHACAEMPIGFARGKTGIIPIALMSLQHGNNLFVSNDGTWLGDYIPGILRCYPFKLVRHPEHATPVICIDETSGLLNDSSGEAFFDHKQQPTDAFKEVIKFLAHLEHERAVTHKVCARLDELQLFRPWNLANSQDSMGERVHGVLRIDEKQLNSLPDNQFLEIRSLGGLPFIYSHLLSTNRLQVLERLKKMHAHIENLHGRGRPNYSFSFDDDIELKFE